MYQLKLVTYFLILTIVCNVLGSKNITKKLKQLKKTKKNVGQTKFTQTMSTIDIDEVTEKSKPIFSGIDFNTTDILENEIDNNQQLYSEVDNDYVDIMATSKEKTETYLHDMEEVRLKSKPIGLPGRSKHGKRTKRENIENKERHTNVHKRKHKNHTTPLKLNTLPAVTKENDLSSRGHHYRNINESELALEPFEMNKKKRQGKHNTPVAKKDSDFAKDYEVRIKESESGSELLRMNKKKRKVKSTTPVAKKVIEFRDDLDSEIKESEVGLEFLGKNKNKKEGKSMTLDVKKHSNFGEDLDINIKKLELAPKSLRMNKKKSKRKTTTPIAIEFGDDLDIKIKESELESELLKKIKREGKSITPVVHKYIDFGDDLNIKIKESELPLKLLELGRSRESVTPVVEEDINFKDDVDKKIKRLELALEPSKMNKKKREGKPATRNIKKDTVVGNGLDNKIKESDIALDLLEIEMHKEKNRKILSEYKKKSKKIKDPVLVKEDNDFVNRDKLDGKNKESNLELLVMNEKRKEEKSSTSVGKKDIDFGDDLVTIERKNKESEVAFELLGVKKKKRKTKAVTPASKKDTEIVSDLEKKIEESLIALDLLELEMNKNKRKYLKSNNPVLRTKRKVTDKMEKPTTDINLENQQIPLYSALLPFQNNILDNAVPKKTTRAKSFVGRTISPQINNATEIFVNPTDLIRLTGEVHGWRLDVLNAWKEYYGIPTEENLRKLEFEDNNDLQKTSTDTGVSINDEMIISSVHTTTEAVTQ